MKKIKYPTVDPNEPIRTHPTKGYQYRPYAKVPECQPDMTPVRSENPDDYGPNEGIWYTRHSQGIQQLEVPVTKEDSYAADTVTETHPAYGMISIHRCTGKRRLFGSDAEHSTFFMLRIHHGSRSRSVRHDFYMADGRLPIVEVELTGAQLIQLFTEMNQGDGVPCTLEYSEKDGEFPAFPPDNRIEKTVTEAKEAVANLIPQVQEAAAFAQELRSRPRVGKGDLDELISKMEKMVQDLRSNIPFATQQVGEILEDAVNQAKVEAETVVATTFHRAGLRAIGESLRADKKEVLKLGLSPDAVRLPGGAGETDDNK